MKTAAIFYEAGAELSTLRRDKWDETSYGLAGAVQSGPVPQY